MNKERRIERIKRILSLEFNGQGRECLRIGLDLSYQSATKLQNSIDFVECKAFRENPYHS